MRPRALSRQRKVATAVGACGWAALLLGCLLSAFAARADRRDFVFSRVEDQHGLVQGSVQALLQDTQGYLWIGTQAGLQRYDGRSMQRIGGGHSNGDALPENFIRALALAADGQLWVGSNSHYLAAIDLNSGRVRLSPVLGDAARDRVLALAVAVDGFIWVATAAGLERFDPRAGERTEVLRREVSSLRSVGLALDEKGRVLLTTDDGLQRIDPDTFESVQIGPPRPAFALHRDATGKIWLGGADGLAQLDAAGTLRPVPVAAIGAVRQIVSDGRGRLWISRVAGGLLQFDPANGELRRFHAQPNIPGSLPENMLASLLVDRGGQLWVGGESMGLSRTPVDGARFSLLLEPPRALDMLANNNIRNLQEADAGRLWAGTMGGSLKRIDIEQGGVEEWIEPVARALGVDPAESAQLRIFSLAKGEAGNLWVACDQGLVELDPGSRRAVQRQATDEAGKPLTTALRPRSLLRTRDGRLIVGTVDAGVFIHTPEDGRWQQVSSAASEGAVNSVVVSLFEDRAGHIWIGTIDGMVIRDGQSGKLHRYRHLSEATDSLSDNIVRAVLQARDGRVWVANHGGLDRVEGKELGDLRFVRHGAEHGLPDATFYGLLEDRDGVLWLSSNRGITRFDPRKPPARSFGLGDGLQGLEFNGGAQLALADGRLVFGGTAGINLFNPLQIQPSDYQPAVVLAGMQVGSRSAARHFLGERPQIEMAQDERLLRFQLAVLDFAAPADARIDYRLDGFDSDWATLGSSGEITYTNLPAGNYLLRARGTSADGVRSPRELSVPLRVVPEWWSSVPAKIGYAVLLALIAGLLWRGQRRRRRAEQALLREIAEREERLKLALWGSGDEFWDWDVVANVVHRIGADQLLGRAAEEDLSTDEWRTRAVHPDDLGRVQALLQAHITGQTPAFESEHRVRNAEGQWVWVRSRGKVVERDEQNNALRIAGTARDITHSRFAERDRRIASEVLNSMAEAVAVVDLAFRFVAVNPAFSRITGYSEDEVLGQPSSLLDSSQQATEFYQQLRTTTERDGHWKGEIWQRRKTGDEFLGWIEITEVRDNLGARTHFVAVVADITDQKRAELELRYLANYDTLTGLPNRTLLAERLERAVLRARRANARVGVLFLDLDRFKDINDTMGHAAGDRLLKAAAARLQETVRAADTVARLGGDEFTVVLEDLQGSQAAEQMAARIVHAFEAPLDIEGRAETTISPSIGIAIYPDHASTPTDLLKFADTAMYQAKERGRNTWQMYTEAMDAETRRRASMIAALRKALDRGEFSLMFQPKLSLQDGRITGVEALLRWQSDELGPVSPAVFVPLAEETGLIVTIGEWVLREACMTLARWRRAGCNDLVMAVNISVLQLLRGHLQGHVEATLKEFAVPANRLELEVTESMVMANAEQAILAMRALKALGVSLAIDDFGTGYSSLIYLKRLPIDTLKIDKAFVGDLTSDPDDEAITATIITMAHSLGLNVVAEGTETRDQVEYLSEQGCDEIQGYWLSWPLQEQACLDFIRGWQPERLKLGWPIVP